MKHFKELSSPKKKKKKKEEEASPRSLCLCLYLCLWLRPMISADSLPRLWSMLGPSGPKRSKQDKKKTQRVVTAARSLLLRLLLMQPWRQLRRERLTLRPRFIPKGEKLYRRRSKIIKKQKQNNTHKPVLVAIHKTRAFWQKCPCWMGYTVYAWKKWFFRHVAEHHFTTGKKTLSVCGRRVVVGWHRESRTEGLPPVSISCVRLIY